MSPADPITVPRQGDRPLATIAVCAHEREFLDDYIVWLLVHDAAEQISPALTERAHEPDSHERALRHIADLQLAFELREEIGWGEGESDAYTVTVTERLLEKLRVALEAITSDLRGVEAARAEFVADPTGQAAKIRQTPAEWLASSDRELALHERQRRLCADLIARIELQAVPGMNAITTLTRAEAVAVAWQLDHTRGDVCGIDMEASTSEDCWAAVRRLTLEATIRDCGMGWGTEHSPDVLDFRARDGDGQSALGAFALRAPGAGALRDLLPEFVTATHDDLANGDDEGMAGARERLRALHRLADRLGVEIPQTVA